MLIFKKYTQNLPFAYDTSSLFLPWIMMLMVFLASLTMAGSLAVNNMTEHWNSSIAGSLTVQVMPSSVKAAGNMLDNTMAEVDRAVAVLKQAKGIKDVRVLSDAELGKLLEPWLGNIDLQDDIPVPRLIDVKINMAENVDFPKLKDELAKYAPNASLDIHRVWLAKLMSLAATLNFLAWVVMLLALVTTAVTVMYATFTSLEVHRPAIELLHLIGARDAYISLLFSRRTLTFSFGGALVGMLLAIPLIIIIGTMAAGLEGGVLANASLSALQWLLIAALPFAAAILSGFTAFLTVGFKLKRTM